MTSEQPGIINEGTYVLAASVVGVVEKEKIIDGSKIEEGDVVVAIASNDAVQYPQDGPDGMAQETERAGYTFPYLFDETQEVAKAYQAACTPDFFLFDRNRKLVYRGQFDDSRPGSQTPVTGRDLGEAVDAVLRGDAPSIQQRSSIGCNIKWKPGNAPSYFG